MNQFLIILALLIGLSPDAQSKTNLSAPFDGCASQAWRDNFVGARAFYGGNVKKIQLTNSPLKAMVDDDDFEQASKFTWQLNKRHGYVSTCAKINGKWRTFTLHRFIANTPSGLDTDHKDRNKLNNQKYNLRPATRSQNNANSVGIGKKRAAIRSTFKGVCWDKSRGKWIARICCNKKHIMLGRFSSERKAAEEYDKSLKLLFGDFARPNFV
jgi:AP2 domain